MTYQEYAAEVERALSAIVIDAFSRGVTVEDLIRDSYPGADPQDPMECGFSRLVYDHAGTRPASVRSVLFTCERALVTAADAGPCGETLRVTVAYPESVTEAIKAIVGYSYFSRRRGSRARKD